ncbi:MAG: family 16 glycosylhydrolase [Acholeplasmatales bacterium]|nr:family 16 glycosylhydrolase [Acholeplasmatales bacterium]
MKGLLKKTLGLFLLSGIAALSMTGCKKKNYDEVTPEKEGYNLLWADEFNGDALNDEIWMREVRPAGWTNAELQKYVKDERNGYVKKGKFVIKGIEEEIDNNHVYTSCKLRNQEAYAFKYGRVEARAKVPAGKGLWPAIWMMPLDEDVYGQWPKCGEIDIMEILGDATEKAYGTLHWGEPHAEKQGTVTLTDTTFADDFHTFAIEWEPGEIRWFIDDVQYLKVNDWFTAVDGEEEKPYPAPFNQDFCIQINLAIGGKWPGNPEYNAKYMKKAEFEIDYVRVYQKDSYDENVTKPEKSFRDPDETGNYITNNVITNNSNLGWIFHKEDTGNGSVEAIENGFKITSSKNGEKDYSVQLFHTQMPVLNGKTYKVSFDIKADAARTINEVCIDGGNGDGWTRYWSKKVDVTTSVQHVEGTFTMNRKSNNEARFEFNMGNTTSTANIYITNIRFEEVE